MPLSPADAEALNRHVSRQYEQFINPSLLRLIAFMGFDRVEYEAEGSIIRDAAGNEFIDCLGGFGIYTLGHRHPAVVKAVEDQLHRMPLPSKVMLGAAYGEMAELLARHSPGDLTYTFACNSGTEAVEGAIKIARLATGKSGIAYTTNAYHGKTMGALSITDRAKYQDPCRPLLEGMCVVPFNDLDRLEHLLTTDKTIGAFIVEPVQGEGGVNIATGEFLRGAQELCRASGVLLILDEVQTGMGRTGKLFAAEHHGLTPDLMCLAKALGGGVMPIGAILGTPRVWQVFEDNPLIHSSTFGGNPMACAAAAAAIRVTVEERLPEQAAYKGDWLLAQLQGMRLRFPELVTDVRGLGLMIGMEFGDDDVAGLLISSLANRGVVVAYTLNNPRVIRLEPALNIPDELLHRVVEAFEFALGEVRAMLVELEGAAV
ncbi:MAG TPA: aminotransferase class III-fold pyridoxal phosphate-dependent enzyme [bacterium]|nr:aminotransferase class III-fold pyridoxal phosphate-dependent enzyme [bacterium]